MKSVSSVFSTLLTIVLMIGALGMASGSVQAAPSTLHISWDDPTDSESGLVRAIGDAGIWTFNVQLANDIQFSYGPNWSYPGGNGADPAWGVWGTNGPTLAWSAPNTGGEFTVTVSGRIRKKVNGAGGGGAGTFEEKDFLATWEGDMDGPCPIDLWHTNLKCKEVRLAWTKCVDVAAEFSSYTLYGPSTTTTSPTNVAASITSQGTTSHLVQDLQPNTTYYFMLKVVHGGETTTHYETVITPASNVDVYVRRTGTGTWSNSAIVAAGGYDSNEHKGDIKIVVTDDDDAPLANQTVSISGAGANLTTTTTNSNGEVFGTFLSGVNVEEVTVTAEAGQGGSIPPTAIFDQRWNKDAKNGAEVSTTPWETLGYFIPGDASALTYIMKLAGDGAAITKHSMNFETTKLVGIEWDPNVVVNEGGQTYTGDYVVKIYTKKYSAELQPGGKYYSLSSYGGPTETAGTGRYVGSVTAHDYVGPEGIVDYFVDEVHFQAKDNIVKRHQAAQ